MAYLLKVSSSDPLTKFNQFFYNFCNFEPILTEGGENKKLT